MNFQSQGIRINFLFILIILSLFHFGNIYSMSGGNIAVVTYVSDNEQERSVKALIKSIRELSGSYSACNIYVVLGDPENFPCTSINEKDVELLPIEMDKSFMDYPLAIKAFVAAQVEKIVKDKVESLVWFDPGVVVLNSFDALDLKNKYDAALRPVTLSNNISISPGKEPDDYWEPIYKMCGIDYQNLPVIKTIVDDVEIQPYYNCEVFSINPKLGICEEWARNLTVLLKDEKYQKNVCSTFLRKLFLHQAVLSGVISSKINPERIKSLPITSGYPFNQHDRLPDDKKVSSLNECSVVIFDYAWDRIPTWMNQIKIDDPLQQWLFDTYLDYLKLTNNLYRIEGSCNSYLVTTDEGSVLIDPAGASVEPAFFKKVIEEYPLKAILLTHAHQDHSDDIAIWRNGMDIPVIAQREFKTYFKYQSDFAGFFSRRNAIWAGKPIPVEPTIKSNSSTEPTIFFADDYEFKFGGFTFNMIHTPGETPDHTTIWIPKLSSVLVGDNYYEYFINNSTFRGTMIRPILGYISALDTALSFNPKYFLPGHGSPIVGAKVINETVGNFRDALQYIYDETIKGINEGKDVYTLMKEIKLPDNYNIGQYYGKTEWTIRGIYQEYVGWFDENPATMYSEPVSSIYNDITELAGVEALNKRAEKLLNEKEYVKVLHLTEIILNSTPADKTANEIRKKALEALKTGTRNYIERIWLDYGIRKIKESTGDLNK
ncbi:MAG: alkyl sulfatase dimerization domain-containing protein [bacterium]